MASGGDRQKSTVLTNYLIYQEMTSDLHIIINPQPDPSRSQCSHIAKWKGQLTRSCVYPRGPKMSAHHSPLPSRDLVENTRLSCWGKCLSAHWVEEKWLTLPFALTHLMPAEVMDHIPTDVADVLTFLFYSVFFNLDNICRSKST